MKKTLCLILTACMLFTALSVNAFAAEETGTPLTEITSVYDFNGDGNVNLDDARTVLRVSAGLEEPNANLVYDLNGDGYSSIDDVKLVLSIVMGVDVEITGEEFLLSLFRSELNNVKNVRPGFVKTATTQCHSMLVTTRNAPDSSLNVTNMEFDDYTNKTCDYMEDLLDGAAGLLIPSSQKAEIRAYIAELRTEAKEMYDLKTTTKTVRKNSSHYAYFPVNNLGNSCFLTLDDIKSIRCYEEDGYIIREVLMNDDTYNNEDTYTDNDFPTGSEGSSLRWKNISYGKVFNIPEFSETENGVKTSNLNEVTFKNGKIVSKIDKLSGLPVSVEYYYDYVADISTIPEIDEDGNEGIEMDSVTNATVTESFVINTVTKN